MCLGSVGTHVLPFGRKRFLFVGWPRRYAVAGIQEVILTSQDYLIRMSGVECWL